MKQRKEVEETNNNSRTVSIVEQERMESQRATEHIILCASPTDRILNGLDGGRRAGRAAAKLSGSAARLLAHPLTHTQCELLMFFV